MRGSRDKRESTGLAAAVTAAPLLLAAGIGIVPQLHGLWLQAGVVAVMLVVGVVIAVRIVRSARNLLEGQPGDDEVVGYKDDRETGILLKGDIENVSLRVSTVHRIIDTLTHAVPREERQTALYECGRAIGENWVADFRHALPKLEIDSADLARQIVKWSEYDATAGMGRLTIAVHPKTGEGLAVLTNSFLSRETARFPLNWWFAGYLAGSLHELLGCAINVEVIDPRNRAAATVYFKVTPESQAATTREPGLPPRDPRSVARGAVWLRRLRTPLAGE